MDGIISDDHSPDHWDIAGLTDMLFPIIPIKPIEIPADEYKSFNKSKLKHMLKEEAVKLYEEKEAQFPEAEQMRELERVILLKVIDRKWMDHIDDMDQLRQGDRSAGLRPERPPWWNIRWRAMKCLTP